MDDGNPVHWKVKPEFQARREYELKIGKHYNSLQIEVLKGTNLIACDKDGFSDPYIVIYYGKKAWEKKKRPKGKKEKQGTTAISSIIQNTLNPVWNEKFIFTIVDFDCDVWFEVFDSDKGFLTLGSDVGDDFMGKVHLDIKNMYPSKDGFPFKLEGKSKGKDVTGTISLKFTFLDQED